MSETSSNNPSSTHNNTQAITASADSYSKKKLAAAIAVLILSTLMGFLLVYQFLPLTYHSIASLPPINSPEEAQNRVRLVSSRLTSPTVAQKYEQMLRDAGTYANTNLPPGIVEGTRAGMYESVYSQLVGQYYASRDQEILALAKQLRKFIRETYPTFFNSGDPKDWEIKEN